MKRNQIIEGDAVKVLADMPEAFVDLSVTSPPYDDLRDYCGYCFNAESMLQAIYRVTKPGGVCVWIVGDKVDKGDKTLSHFEHALLGKRLGWLCYDVMIWQKLHPCFPRFRAYTPCYELMIIFSKGSPLTFNPLKTPTIYPGAKRRGTASRKPDGSRKIVCTITKKEKIKTNLWSYPGGSNIGDKFAHLHSAPFPEALAADHIASWSEPGDFVLDPMAGSGTTCKMAASLGRDYLGIDISYKKRLERLDNIEIKPNPVVLHAHLLRWFSDLDERMIARRMKELGYRPGRKVFPATRYSDERKLNIWFLPGAELKAPDTAEGNPRLFQRWKEGFIRLFREGK